MAFAQLALKTSMDPASIKISGARQHNLKNIDLEIPRNALTVITGVSGSGKSSLAFKTLYAEGQRRYVQSLTTYARQYLDQLEKPDVDFVEGLSPAIAIEQRTAAGTPRSTVATVTEIHDYLRILFAAVGIPHDPATGEAVRRQSTEEIVESIITEGLEKRCMVAAPIPLAPGEKVSVIADRFQREGFVRMRINDRIIDLDDENLSRWNRKENRPAEIELIVDRLVIRPDSHSRLTDSTEAALHRGRGLVRFLVSDGGDAWEVREATTAYLNPKTGFRIERLTPRHFSFNSHLGACPRCEGLGTQAVLDTSLFVRDKTKPLLGGALREMWPAKQKMAKVSKQALKELAEKWNVDMHRPYGDLPEAFRHAVIDGDPENEFEGLFAQARRLLQTSRSKGVKQRLRRLMSDELCPACQGRRLRPEMLAVTIPHNDGSEVGLSAFSDLRIDEALAWMEDLQLSKGEERYAEEIKTEILKRLQFLQKVGLGYLALSRKSTTLSGGEAQRIRLATQLGGGLVGVLYVLDEPSIGLHARDNAQLLATLEELRDLGNTVVVVEHDEETMRNADFLVDMGPGAGPMGGEIVAAGTVAEVSAHRKSVTAKYLRGDYVIKPKRRRNPGEQWITVRNASEHNLQNIDAAFPAGCFVCVTGVSGSGKSTLIDGTLHPALGRHFHGATTSPGAHDRIDGLEWIDRVVAVNQAPIGRSPRSNPATYVGAFDLIRKWFAQLPSARLRGYKANRFSFNVRGGRCEHCQGDGSIRIDMHFLTDVYVTCEACGGSRYNRETLQVAYKGKNISDILNMSVSGAVKFFRKVPKIYQCLLTLDNVGLGYLKLGQSATTLSGGEAQRVKLAAELSRKGQGKTLYLLDEPTTGLHWQDIETLLNVFCQLRDLGHTLVVVEHHLDVIRCADWIIDLGPEGGDGGGRIVVAGPPEVVAACTESHTGRCLSQ